VPRTLLLSGFDLINPELPSDARLLLPPMPLHALEDFRAAIAQALEEPFAGPPLSEQVKPHGRVAIVIDDLSLPVPPISQDPRREMLEVVVRHLEKLGVRRERVAVVVANGLSRQWRAAELADFLGPTNLAGLAVQSHDAESGPNLLRLGEEPEGPVEFNRALLEADVLVHLNVVSTPLMAGLFGVASGASGYRTARFLGAPALMEADPSPFVAGSAFDQIHHRVAGYLQKQVPVFQVATVLNNQLWAPTLTNLLRSDPALSRPLQMWNSLPVAVRHRAARMLRASYRPLVALGGAPDPVAAKAREVFYRQHEVSHWGQADVVVFGLPDLGPASVRTAQNPVLATHLALGYVANLFTERPLLKQGGVLVFANPLAPVFDRRAHLPHEEFYEKVLRLERDPKAIHERFEPYFAGRPEFVANYQRRFAFHGAHPLYAWYQCAAARKRAGKIIVAHGDPRACARFGFSPAADVKDALAKAREHRGQAASTVAVLELPPPFWVRVR
jgi:lactate racemase